jgi:lipopolysaccharide transport system ATP-binding protein
LDSGTILADGPSHEVVNTYMNLENPTEAEQTWPDLSKAPGDDVVRLRAVRVRTEENLVSDAVDIRRPVVLEMEYDVLEPGHVLMVYFHVVTEGGIHAFSTIDNEPAWRTRPRPSGCYLSRAWIPGNFLSEGKLFAGAAIRTLHPAIPHFSASNHIAFRVVDSTEGDSARVDYGGEMYGVVRPMLKWETRPVPKESKIAADSDNAQLALPK